MTCLCLADEDTVRGFRLAGVEGRCVTDAEDCLTQLAQAATRPDLGVVLVDRRLADAARERLNAFRILHDRPLIVEIARPSLTATDESSTHRLVRKATGMGIDLDEVP